MSIHPEKLLGDHIIKLNGKTYVDAKILDVFAGKRLREKSRKLKSILVPLIDGTDLKLEECLSSYKQTCVVAVGIMQLIIIRGLQNEFPWSQLRRSYVTYFFPNAPQLIPDAQPFANPLEHRCRSHKEPILEPFGEQLELNGYFSPKLRQIISNLSTRAAEQKRIHAKATNLYQFEVKALLEGIFPNYLSYEKLKTDIYLCVKTGNWANLLKKLRSVFYIDGLGRKQLIPGCTSVAMLSKPMISKFIFLLKPQRTFSGFRVDLVRAVKVISFFLYKGRTDLENIKLDIWGDGVQIGKKDQTRMAIRFLEGTSISNQSSDALFSFAVFQGNAILPFF